MFQAASARDDTWLLRGVVVPLGMIVLAILVFTQAGEQGSLGPLDLATANIVVAAMWGLGPAIGGLLSRSLSGEARKRSILIIGSVPGVVIGLVCLIGAGTGSTPCVATTTPNVFVFILGSIGVGAGLGAGTSLAMWLAGVAGRGRAWILGLALGWAVSVLALVLPLAFYSNTVTCYH